MTNETEKKTHYNLYYIFEEDRENNRLPKSKANVMWINIVNSLQKDDGS